MSTEALVLALTTVVRPTGVAAVAALLTAARPHRLLVAYVVVGMAFSMTVGVLVVVVLAGTADARGRGIGRPLLDAALGVAALAYALATAVGWLPRAQPPAPDGRAARLRGRLKALSPAGAGVAGVLTHLPGLIYLAALNAIAASATGIPDAVLQVLAYNLIWFSAAIAALVLALRRPDLPQLLLAAAASWIGQHRRVLVAAISAGVGAYLLVTGLMGAAADA
jgi:hypothetical protein